MQIPEPSDALLDFCETHELILRIYNNGYHWKIKSWDKSFCLDFWPTTKKALVNKTERKIFHSEERLLRFLQEKFLSK